jgi:hypothetical protein
MPLVVEKHGRSRFWSVRDARGELVVVAAYRVGAERVRELLAGEPPRGVAGRFHKQKV